MTKSNEKVIWDFVSSAWFNQNNISHNENLITAHNVLFSFGIPLCVYERNTKYPFKIRNLKGKHKPHFDLLMKKLDTISNVSWEVFRTNLRVYGNDDNKKRTIVMRGGNPPYKT